MSSEKVEKRDNFFDKFVTSYFDNLWNSNFYLDSMSKSLDTMFEMKKNWNQNMESMLSLLQLPNQQMQQKTLHALNSLTSEWRFENDELKYKIEKLEQEISELKKSSDVDKKAKVNSK